MILAQWGQGFRELDGMDAVAVWMNWGLAVFSGLAYWRAARHALRRPVRVVCRICGGYAALFCAAYGVLLLGPFSSDDFSRAMRRYVSPGLWVVFSLPGFLFAVGMNWRKEFAEDVVAGVAKALDDRSAA